MEQLLGNGGYLTKPQILNTFFGLIVLSIWVLMFSDSVFEVLDMGVHVFRGFFVNHSIKMKLTIEVKQGLLTFIDNLEPLSGGKNAGSGHWQLYAQNNYRYYSLLAK